MILKKSAVILFILIILLVTVASAQKIEVTSARVDNKAFPGSEVLFILKVKNNDIREQTIRVTPDPFSVAPFSDYIESINIKPGSTNIAQNEESVFQVSIKYALNLKPERAYTTNVVVKSLQDENFREVSQLTSFIMSPGDIINIKADINDEIIPGIDTKFDVNFKNNVNEDFSYLDFYVISGDFNEKYKVNIKRKEEITKTFSLNLNQETLPGDYELFLRLFKDGSLKGEKVINIKVKPSSNLNEKTSRESRFLTNKVIITKSNNGNLFVEKNVKYPIGSFERFFTKTTLKGEYIKENQENYLSWDLKLKPGEEINIEIETDYTSLFFTVVVFVILISLIYYVKSRSLRITKKIITVKDDKGHHLKVVLTIQNNTNKNINDLKIIDLLPALIKHYSNFGTLEQKHIQQGSKGLRFVWELKTLHSGEERVITYKIEPQLNLFGNIRLPPASIQFTGKGNRLVIRRSNIARLELKSKH